MQKVLYIIHALDFGGAERVVIDYCKNLNKALFEPVIMCKCHGSILLEEEVKNSNIKLVIIDDYINRKTFGWKFKRTSISRRLYKEISPDIVHSHMQVNTFALLMMNEKKAKYFHTIHSQYERHWNKNPRKILDFISFCRICKKYNTTIFVLNTRTEQKIRHNLFIKNVSCILTNNGIDFSKFDSNENKQEIRKRLNIDADKFVLCCVARFNSVKNHLFLLEVFLDYSKINSSALLLLAGDGEERNNIEDFIRNNKIEDKVILLGNRDDVEDILKCSDCFMLTSKSEAFPLVVLEAQIAKKPCILSDVVPANAVFSNSVTLLPVSVKTNMWVEAIIQAENIKNSDIKLGLDIEKYNIINVIRKIENSYF